MLVEKVCFSKKFLFSIPIPFPVVKGCVCSVGFASLQSPWHTRPASVPGLSVGLPPQTKQGCLQSATQSHCTMQWHKWLTTCTGTMPQSKDALVACQKFCTMQNPQSKQRSTPHFYQRYRFFDRPKRSISGRYAPLFFYSNYLKSVHSPLFL